MKVVLNRSYGGFSPSLALLLWLYAKGCELIEELTLDAYLPRHFGESWTAQDLFELGGRVTAEMRDQSSRGPGLWVDSGVVRTWCADVDTDSLAFRSHPMVVRAVEALSDKATHHGKALLVVEVPDGIPVEIVNYDGKETVREIGRCWPSPSALAA